MVTYQDLIAVGDRDLNRAEFVRSCISKHKATDLWKTAAIADDYDRCRNTTIMQYQKTVTTVTGKVVPDTYSAVHRSTSNFFNIFTTQLNQYLLGNGVKWGQGNADEKLGGDFDIKLQRLGKKALCGGVSFGFWNFDHLEVFSVLEFAPLYDEETGGLMAGVRFWQVDETRPLRATLYELDGYTNYLYSNKYKPGDDWVVVNNGIYMQPKKPYILKLSVSAADGVEILDGENYPTFPIVPLWANDHHQSEIVGLREKIDAYDFILNGYEDDLDNAQLYWIIKGAGGMDDPDLARFLDRLRTVKAVAPEDGQDVAPVQVEIPHEARERLLDRLEHQLYKDAMIMNPNEIASGAATATQIKAAYEPQNVKADQFEYCVIDFIKGIMALAGVEDDPTFDRSKMVNTQEEVQTVILAAQYLDADYVTGKILSLLGDGDQTEEMLKKMSANSVERLGGLSE